MSAYDLIRRFVYGPEVGSGALNPSARMRSFFGSSTAKSTSPKGDLPITLDYGVAGRRRSGAAQPPAGMPPVALLRK